MTPQELQRLIYLRSEYKAEIWRIALRKKTSPEEVEAELQRITARAYDILTNQPSQ